MFSPFNFSLCNWCIMAFNYGFDLHFPNEKCLVAILTSSLMKYLFKYFIYLFLNCIFSWVVCFLIVLRIFKIYIEYKYFMRQMLYKYFLPVCGLCFYTFNNVFQRAQVFNNSLLQCSLLQIIYLILYLKYFCPCFMLWTFKVVHLSQWSILS